MQTLPKTIVSLIDALDERGDEPGVVALNKEGRATWTAGELAAHAQRMARGLRKTGLPVGGRVAIFAESRPEAIVASLATIVAGGILAPLDVQLSEEELSNVLRDCDPDVVLTTSNRHSRIEPLAAECGFQVFLFDDSSNESPGWRSLLSDVDGELPRRGADDLAVLFYTSGTTGPPKGVPLTQANIAMQWQAIADAALVEPDDRILNPLPLHHVYPFVIGVLTPLALGLTIVLPQSLTGPEILRALREADVTIVIGVPRLYTALYDGLESRIASAGRIASTVFRAAMAVCVGLHKHWNLPLGRVLLRTVRKKLGPNVRMLISGGSPLDAELGWKLQGLGWRIVIGYGLTETSPILTLNPPGESPLESVGRPLPDVELRLDPSGIVNGESETDSSHTEPRERGEILARGPGVFAGYWNRPGKTDEAFTDDGWYRTGDLGEFDDRGNLFIIGRASTMIVTEGGENIQPDDVEEKYEAAAEIREIAVLQRERNLVGVVVPDEQHIREADNGEIDVEQVVRGAVDEASQSLASYQRVSDVVISRESLPRTRLGKIRRHKLEERYEQARDQAGQPRREGPMRVEEMSADDRQLLEHPHGQAIWEMLAERFPERPLTPDSSLRLDLGIDSMEWLNLSLNINERTGAQLDDETIAGLETVRDLLREIPQASRDEATAADLRENPDSMLSEDQRRYINPLGPIASLVPRFGYAVNRVCMRLFFRARVKGENHLPEEGPFVIAANHVSKLDPFLIAASLKGDRLADTCWAAWTGIAFRNFLARQFSRLARAIPVDPARGPVASLATAAAVLRKDKVLVWFPEGERARDGRLQEFKPGLGLLLKHQPVPVVPASIHGTFEALPTGKVLPRFRRTQIVFGPAVQPEELAAQGEGDEEHLRIVDALRDRIADLGP